MVVNSGSIGEYIRNDLLILYYNTWQNIIIYVFRIYGHPACIYGFQINLKPRSLSWAGCDFQTVDCLWNISTWPPRHFSHNVSNITLLSCCPPLREWYSHSYQTPKVQTQGLPSIAPRFLRVNLSRSLFFTTSLSNWSSILSILLHKHFQSHPSPLILS